MKTYELTYIISPDITPEKAAAQAKEIESIIQSKEGNILKQSNPIAKTLSYPIKKRASGFFGVLEFQLEPEKLIELKEIIAKDGRIVRHMIIIKEAAELKRKMRTKTKSAPVFEVGQKTKVESIKEEKPSPAKLSNEHSEVKEKVELKDIEHELDEILGE